MTSILITHNYEEKGVVQDALRKLNTMNRTSNTIQIVDCGTDGPDVTANTRRKIKTMSKEHNIIHLAKMNIILLSCVCQ